jgi:hypothetical protein
MTARSLTTPGRAAPARRAALTSSVAPMALAALAACGGGGGTTPPTEVGPRLDVQAMVLVGEAGDTLFSHQDHWHGFPVVPAGGRASYRKYFVASARSSDDHEMPARGDWFTLAAHADANVAVTVEQPAMAGWEGDRLSGALVGRQAGASRVNFVVRRGTTTLREIPPLPFTVR